MNFSERENKQVAAKKFQKGPFSAVYTGRLDCLMTSQNPSFRKNYALAGFQYEFFVSVRMCKNTKIIVSPAKTRVYFDSRYFCAQKNDWVAKIRAKLAIYV